MKKSFEYYYSGEYLIDHPEVNGSILIKDLIINASKVRGGSVGILLKDNEHELVIFRARTDDAPVSKNIQKLNWLGWKNAWLVMQSEMPIDIQISVNYEKLNMGDNYRVWETKKIKEVV